jgi:hypothetical protein
MKPFKLRVCVLSFETGRRLQDVSGEEARDLVECQLAYCDNEEGRKVIGVIVLRVGDDCFQSAIRARNIRKGRPRPSLNADSSTGDAGRGNTQGPRVRTLHLRPPVLGAVGVYA